MSGVAYLHVGAPKTGTTFLQGVFWANRERLRDAGLHVLGQRQADHYRAGHDLRDLPYDPADVRLDWRGAWDAVAAAGRTSDAEAVIVSDEHLAVLTPEQVARAVRSLAPREVHVIYAERDLAGLLPSEWQEYVKHGSQFTYAEWTKRVMRTREHGPGKWFWSVHDPVDVVERWTTQLPAGHFHLITLPPKGAPKDELWRRFCTVVGIDPSVAEDLSVATNTSLGLPETEVLRRVNAALPDSFPKWHSNALARDLLATKILSPRSVSARPALPDGLRDKVASRTDTVIAAIPATGCDVVGDLTELKGSLDPAAESARPSQADVLDAAVDGLAGLLVEMARVRDERRRRWTEPAADGQPSWWSRARLRVAVAAGDHKSLGWAVDRYRRYRARGGGQS